MAVARVQLLPADAAERDEVIRLLKSVIA